MTLFISCLSRLPPRQPSSQPPFPPSCRLPHPIPSPLLAPPAQPGCHKALSMSFRPHRLYPESHSPLLPHHPPRPRQTFFPPPLCQRQPSCSRIISPLFEVRGPTELQRYHQGLINTHSQQAHSPLALPFNPYPAQTQVYLPCLSRQLEHSLPHLPSRVQSRWEGQASAPRSAEYLDQVRSQTTTLLRLVYPKSLPPPERSIFYNPLSPHRLQNRLHKVPRRPRKGKTIAIQTEEMARRHIAPSRLPETIQESPLKHRRRGLLPSRTII